MLGLIAILSASITAVVIGRARYVREEHTRWQRIGEALEMAWNPSATQGWMLHGTLERDLDVTIDCYTSHRGRGWSRTTRIIIDAHGRVPRGLVLGDEHYWLGSIEQRGNPNQRTGDRRFDACIGLHGSDLHVSALFSERTRGLLLRAAERFRIHLLNGRLVLEIPGSEPALRELQRALEQAPAIIHALSLERLREQLASNATRDSSARVRLRSLRLLVTHFPDSSEALAACRKALLELDPEHRLCAAMALGEEGIPVVTALASSVTVAVELRVHAAEHLRRYASSGTLIDVCHILLSSPSCVLQAVAIRLAHEAGEPISDVELSRIILADDADLRLLCTALGEIRDRRAEPLLLLRLETAYAALRRDIAAALAHVGTRHAIPVLARLEEDRDDSVLQQLARTSRAHIRARLDPNRAGAISLTDPEAVGEGALSPAEDPRGRLSDPH